MMQKNLTCKSLRDAQKNMLWFSIVLTLVTFLFLLLGALLFIYAERFDIALPLMDGDPKTDLLFPEIALNTGLGMTLASVFILGLIAAAYSSADSALTSLTTSFCVDILDLNKHSDTDKKRIRKQTHIGMSVLLIFVIIAFKHILDSNVINSLLTAATYTYGPLLGLFAFGIFTNYKIKDKWVWLVALFSVSISYSLGQIPAEQIGGYVIGYELLPINGLITFLGLVLIRRQ
jgi:Na+/proline symporter